MTIYSSAKYTNAVSANLAGVCTQPHINTVLLYDDDDDIQCAYMLF